MSNELTIAKNHSLSARMADKFGVEAKDLFNTLKATAFKQNGQPVSNEQMFALLTVCEKYDLNPFVKQIYAFPDKNGGIVPLIGIDGWDKLINDQPQFDGVEFKMPPADEWIQIDKHAKICPEWITAKMYRKDRSKPIEVTEYLDENYKPPYVKNNYAIQGAWQTHTKRMLRHKALKEAARIAFGITGVYDEDEGKIIAESARQEPVVLTDDNFSVVPEPVSEPVTASVPAQPAKSARKRKPEPEPTPEPVHETESAPVVDIPAEVMDLDFDI